MNTPEAKLSRRSFLKLAAGTGAAVFLGSEVKKAATGVISTQHADYYPFYEDHLVTIDFNSREMPHLWDYHWLEGYFDSQDTIPDELSTFRLDGRGGLNNLKILARKGVKLARADVDPPTYTEGLSDITNRLRVFYDARGVNWDPGLHIAGSAVFVTRWKNKIFQGLLGKLTGIDFSNPDKNPFVEGVWNKTKVPRRMLFVPLDIATGYLFINTLAGGVWHNVKPEKSDLPIKSLDAEQITSRVLNRTHGLLTHARPNDMVAFFRNLIWAEKLSEFAEAESNRLGRRVGISFQMGMGHGGFEEFLSLGRPFTTQLLAAYSPEVWNDVVRLNGVDRVVNTMIAVGNDPARGEDPMTWIFEKNFKHGSLSELVTSKTKVE